MPMYNSIHPLSRIVHPDYDLDDDPEVIIHPSVASADAVGADHLAWAAAASRRFRFPQAPHKSRARGGPEAWFGASARLLADSFVVAVVQFFG